MKAPGGGDFLVADALPDSPKLKSALQNQVTKRLPTTFLPFVNQQLREWDTLFPNERQSIERLLIFVDSLNPAQCAALFKDVLDLEQKMGVHQWKFSTSEETIQNASLLARSPYYAEWRRAVLAVYDAADRYAQTGHSAANVRRAILIDLPRPLSVDPGNVWKRWQNAGRAANLNVPAEAHSSGFAEYLVGHASSPNATKPSLLSTVANAQDRPSASAWVLDAGKSLVDFALKNPADSEAARRPILLSYARLDAYRQNFSREMNTMRKDLSDADAIYDHLRKVDVKPWCPEELGSDPAVREFVRSLYLSGNGAVIFGNSFVQWGASEALRRARPTLLVAKFGVRAKPKPFTGVAVFDNPDQINPLPSVDDLPGSSLDAQILAHYIWLSASRYAEYQNSTVCICLAESIAQVYIIAPSEFPIPQNGDTLAMERLRDALSDWIA